MSTEFRPLVIPVTVRKNLEPVAMSLASTQVQFGLDAQATKFQYNMTTDSLIGNYDRFDGEYVVTPTDEDQYLDTSRKVMRGDVTVQAVPYFETTNESGGYTVIIGG